MPLEPLFGKTLKELEAVAASLNLPPYSATQMAHWLYKNPVTSFQEFTNLSKTARQALAERYAPGITPPLSAAVSADGTKKYLYAAGTQTVETAWIPEKNRSTLCVSTQVGCRQGCRFCQTARQGFSGNLSAADILNQYRSLPEFAQITHFVFMGMGEPLDNLEPLLASLEILTAPWGFGFSPRKITVSTIGLLPQLKELMAKSECRLALSLHSPFPEERLEFIPAEKRFPARDVLELFRRTGQSSNQNSRRRLTIEYLLLNNRNDSPRHSAELARILQGLNARVNLIPYHPVPGFPGEPSPPARQEAFRNELNKRGITATIRRSRGLDIGAACGLLSTRQKQKEPCTNP